MLVLLDHVFFVVVVVNDLLDVVAVDGHVHCIIIASGNVEAIRLYRLLNLGTSCLVELVKHRLAVLLLNHLIKFCLLFVRLIIICLFVLLVVECSSIVLASVGFEFGRSRSKPVPLIPLARLLVLHLGGVFFELRDLNNVVVVLDLAAHPSSLSNGPGCE